MEKIKIAHFLLATFWTGWRRWVAWAVCVAAIVLLGILRTATDADFTFASLVILPVLAIAWIGGRKQGLLAAFLASAMWTVADLVTERQFTTQWIPWTNAATRLMTYCLVALLAAQVRRQFEREHTHATRDALTGLHNRRMFLEYGAVEVERAKRSTFSLSVIFLDLDDFKQLNDTQGHDAGDAALRATAKALLGSLRASDGVARLGGDEFAVLLAEIDYADAVKAGEKILREVNAALEDFPPVKASLGVAWFAAADRLFPEMLKAADGLMYEVKEKGKGDVLTRRFATVKESEK
jgi:diguanylate cyclase (GGDEF)-like protein